MAITSSKLICNFEFAVIRRCPTALSQPECPIVTIGLFNKCIQLERRYCGQISNSPQIEIASEGAICYVKAVKRSNCSLADAFLQDSN